MLRFAFLRVLYRGIQVGYHVRMTRCRNSDGWILKIPTEISPSDSVADQNGKLSTATGMSASAGVGNFPVSMKFPETTLLGGKHFVCY